MAHHYISCSTHEPPPDMLSRMSNQYERHRRNAVRPFEKPPRPGLSLTAGVALDPLTPLPGMPSVLKSLERVEQERDRERQTSSLAAVGGWAVGGGGGGDAFRKKEDVGLEELKLIILQVASVQEKLMFGLAGVSLCVCARACLYMYKLMLLQMVSNIGATEVVFLFFLSSVPT